MNGLAYIWLAKPHKLHIIGFLLGRNEPRGRRSERLRECIKLKDYLFKRMPNYAITLTKERSSVLKKNKEKQRQHFRWRERWMEKSETEKERERERDGAFRLYLARTTEHELITHKYIAAATPPVHSYTFNMISLSQTLSFSVISPSRSAHLRWGLAVTDHRCSVLKPFLMST